MLFLLISFTDSLFCFISFCNSDIGVTEVKCFYFHYNVYRPTLSFDRKIPTTIPLLAVEMV